MLRSFLAIELPKIIQKKIEDVQKDLKLSYADVRWVDPGKIHLTLKFFGNIEESRVGPIVESIDATVKKNPPFPLLVQGLGAFPHVKNPRVIWIGLVDEKGVLVSFQKEIENRLEKIGFEPEGRPFQPHLTLGRTKSSRGREELISRMEGHNEEEFGNFQVESVILFKSDLRPTGPIYTALGEIKLEGS